MPQASQMKQNGIHLIYTDKKETTSLFYPRDNRGAAAQNTISNGGFAAAEMTVPTGGFGDVERPRSSSGYTVTERPTMSASYAVPERSAGYAAAERSIPTASYTVTEGRALSSGYTVLERSVPTSGYTATEGRALSSVYSVPERSVPTAGYTTMEGSTPESGYTAMAKSTATPGWAITERPASTPGFTAKVMVAPRNKPSAAAVPTSSSVVTAPAKAHVATPYRQAPYQPASSAIPPKPPTTTSYQPAPSAALFIPPRAPVATPYQPTPNQPASSPAVFVPPKATAAKPYGRASPAEYSSAPKAPVAAWNPPVDAFVPPKTTTEEPTSGRLFSSPPKPVASSRYQSTPYKAASLPRPVDPMTTITEPDTPTVPTSPTQPAAAETSGEDVGRDIMISYSHADRLFMRRLKASLEYRGYTVWVDNKELEAGDFFLNKIGQAIISSKCIVPIVTSSQITSKYCRDELSLAYVSNKPILPVSMAPSQELYPEMETGMRLQLIGFKWTEFPSSADDGLQFDAALNTLIQEIDAVAMEEAEARKKEALNKKPALHKHVGALIRKRRGDKAQQSIMSQKEKYFWPKYFGEQLTVEWKTFIGTFFDAYKEELKMMYAKKDRSLIEKLLCREMEATEGSITFETYRKFISTADEDQPHRLIDRVEDYVAEYYAAREVFDMDSTVRMDAIEHLGKLRSHGVLEVLMDLLRDDDPNVRAVAAISLAKTGSDAQHVLERLVKLLEDKDRLVRESVCLALGRLRAAEPEIVKKIIDLWRNDVISTVRECAELALKQLDTEESKLAIHLTAVLQREIKMMKE